MPESHPYSTDNSKWQALVKRDRAAIGHFVYAVQTTGIFCNPGCSSRLPKRTNVVFFRTPEQAVRAGYRPCKRCTPETSTTKQKQEDIFSQACRRIEQAEKAIPLKALAEKFGLSPSYFQRQFKKRIGLSPKQFTTLCQTQRFQDALKTSTSVTDAMYQAGFSSSSRAYEKNRLAMTPKAFRQGGAGATIHYATSPCYLGWILVGATTQGICTITLGDSREELVEQITSDFPNADIAEADKGFSTTMQEVISLLETQQSATTLPLDIQGTAFQKQVWKVLQDIEPGTTLSYGEVAKRLEKPKAARAVATACGANKIAIAIPCHRVVRSDGSISGYRWGVERKKILLEQEKKDHV